MAFSPRFAKLPNLNPCQSFLLYSIVLVDDGVSMVSIQRERLLLPERVEEKCAHLVKPGFVDIHTHGLSEYTAARHIETTVCMLKTIFSYM